MRQSLKDLLITMPTRDEESNTLSAVTSGGIVTQVTPEAGYIWPDVYHNAESSTEPSPVILIAAPGAMGKSAAAKNMAASLRTIYVDLAQLRVGSGSLTGVLSKALGFKETGEFVEDLKAGRAAIILDSTDEAQLGAGRENFIAFLDDLLWLLSDATAASQVTLLGRRDATDTTLIGLMDLGMNPPMYQIAPLTHPQACDLIDQVLDYRTPETPFLVHRQHPIPFGKLRDELFEGIARALNPDGVAQDYWDSADDFLGYPPVLLALAERLAVENPAADQKSGIPSGQRMLRGELLRTIVESILDREQDKVRARVGDSLGIGVDSTERNVLYGRDEQVSRLLSHTGTAGVTLDVPASLDESDRAKYEENIASFVVDHPFLKSNSFANVVFQDYVRAWAIASELSGLYSTSRSMFLATLPPAGPFFAHFLHTLSSDENGLGRVPEDLVDDAIQSFALGTEFATAGYLHKAEVALLVLNNPAAGVGADDHSDLAFSVTELSGVVVLRSPLARVSFISDHSLILRGREGSLDIGPSVFVVVPELEIDAKSVTVFGSPRGEKSSFSVVSTENMKHDADLRVVALPNDALAINWPDAWHQWKPYFADMRVPNPRLSARTVSQILICLRRIFTSFRASMQDDPSVSADKMDRVIIGQNPVFLATISALTTLGVVTRDNTLYRVHLDSLARYEVSWSDLRGDDAMKSLRKILVAVATSADMDGLKA
jgi:hypothetical protein